MSLTVSMKTKHTLERNILGRGNMNSCPLLSILMYYFKIVNYLVSSGVGEPL